MAQQASTAIGQDAPATTVSQAGMARPQLLSIQYLRGLAALSVLVTHVLQWPLAQVVMPFFKTGRLGVEVFFVISGFIMTTVAGEGRFKPLDFLRRRAVRILPAYWTATLLIAVLALAMPSQFRTTVVTLEGFVKSLLFIPCADPKAPLLLLGWTLNFEVFFYLVFASLFFLRSGARTLVICAAFAGLIAVGASLDERSHVEAIYTSYSLIGFCAGTLLAQAHRAGWLDGRGALPALMATAGVVALFYAVPWEEGKELPLPVHLLMSAAGFGIVAAGLMVEAAGRLPRLSPLEALGNASYSVYLFHMFPVAAFWALGRRFLDLGSVPAYLLLSAVAIVAGLAVGQLCYRLIERPWLDRPRDRSARPARRGLAFRRWSVQRAA